MRALTDSHCASVTRAILKVKTEKKKKQSILCILYICLLYIFCRRNMLRKPHKMHVIFDS